MAATWTALLSTWLNKAISVSRMNAFFSTSGNMQFLYDRVTEDIGAKVYHDADQNVADSAETALAFNSELYDTDGMHDTVTDNTKLTIVTAGKYLLTGYAVFDTNATGVRRLILRVNGDKRIGQQRVGAVDGDFTILNAVAVHSLAIGDYVELCAFQTSGDSLAVKSYTDETPTLAAQLMARVELS